MFDMLFREGVGFGGRGGGGRRWQPNQFGEVVSCQGTPLSLAHVCPGRLQGAGRTSGEGSVRLVPSTRVHCSGPSFQPFYLYAIRTGKGLALGFSRPEC